MDMRMLDGIAERISLYQRNFETIGLSNANTGENMFSIPL